MSLETSGNSAQKSPKGYPVPDLFKSKYIHCRGDLKTEQWNSIVYLSAGAICMNIEPIKLARKFALAFRRSPDDHHYWSLQHKSIIQGLKMLASAGKPDKSLLAPYNPF